MNGRRAILSGAGPALFALGVAGVALGCASAGPAGGGAGGDPASKPGSTSPAPQVLIPDLEVRSLLLLVGDRRLYEPITFEKALDGSAGLRRDLALTVGRLDEPRSRAYLADLMAAPEAEVRRAAAFALGEQGRPEGSRLLLAAAVDPDRETGVVAVEALGKIGAKVADVVETLAPLGEAERWARLLPGLFRFDPEEAAPFAEVGLGVADPELHARAAYALARNPRATWAPRLRELLADPDPFVRGWAARALGEVGEAADLGRLRPLLDDPAPGPIIQALRAGRKLVLAGTAAAADGWRGRLRELLDDPRPHVRVTAVEAAAAWLLDDDLGDALARLAALPAPAAAGTAPQVPQANTADAGERERLPEREEALIALAIGGDPRAPGLVAAATTSTDRDLRAKAVEAAGYLAAAGGAGREAATGLIDRLLHDPEPKVRVAALQAAIVAAVGDPGSGPRSGSAAEVVSDALSRDTDPGVRAAALEWAIDHPVLPIEVLGPATVLALGDRNVESSLDAVKALTARAAAADVDRGAVVAVLEKLAETDEFPVRREAVKSLAALGRTGPAVGPVDTHRAAEVYAEVVQRTARPRTVELRTTAGTLRLRLACPEAPLTCLNFLNLARQGFYDGITFHRVVPDFVVQAGDPRGDGYGGPGYTIRDEVNLLRYDRGAVGMALAGPDTGGSQFFITLSPQPHLDGGYTVFGHVVAGDEVLDRIVRGTVIESVSEVQ